MNCLQFPVWRLAKVAIFTTNVDAENQCLINYKTVCGAPNRHFCQTAVSYKGFFLDFNGFYFIKFYSESCSGSNLALVFVKTCETLYDSTGLIAQTIIYSPSHSSGLIESYVHEYYFDSENLVISECR